MLCSNAIRGAQKTTGVGLLNENESNSGLHMLTTSMNLGHLHVLRLMLHIDWRLFPQAKENVGSESEQVVHLIGSISGHLVLCRPEQVKRVVATHAFP